ncbi:hypothetical protein N2152v2_005536 [Parachlorella kessleri]
MATQNPYQTVEQLGSLLRGQAASDQQVGEQQANGAKPEAGGSPRRGGVRSEAGKRKQGGYGVDSTAALSQLSDLAKEISKVPGAAASVAAQFSQPPQFQQESLIVAPLTFSQPSQPDIPPPVLPDSQPSSNPGDLSGMQAGQQPGAVQGQVGDDPSRGAAAMPAVPGPGTALLGTFTDFIAAHQPMMLATADFMAHPGAFAAMQLNPEDMGGHMGAPREKGSKPTRRGPMDEMRQLVRILVKILPQSIGYIGSGEEAGGGNRISEEQIKFYLEKTLGAAPRPTWGVPGGWNQYLATLFTWATGRTITEEDARRCAKREPGRSWEALEAEMAALGVHPSAWPLPLSLEGVQAAEKNPVPQPVPQIVIKRAIDETGAPVSKRQKGAGAVALPMLDKLGEAELWSHLISVLAECQAKQGKAADQGSLMALKLDAKQRFDTLVGGPAGMNMFQYVPVAMGLDGGQSVMALLGGMQGGMMLPQVAGPQFGLQQQPDVGGLGQSEADQANAAALQAAAANMAAVAMAAAAQQGMGLEAVNPRKRDREDDDPESTGQPSAGEGGVGDEGIPRVTSEAAAFAAAAAAAMAERAKLAPLSSQDARGSLFGALGGGLAAAAEDPTKHAQQGTPYGAPHG